MDKKFYEYEKPSLEEIEFSLLVRGGAGEVPEVDPALNHSEQPYVPTEEEGED